jgi:hypothetical protein
VYHPVGLREELDAVLRERGVRLKQEVASTYCPPIWEAIICAGRLTVHKNERLPLAVCEPCQL